jgi:hypothetical protein
MMTDVLDPTLAAHIAARNSALPTQFPGIDTNHYLEQVVRERAARYAAHVARMTITPDMVQWGMAMTRQYGPYVRVHHFIADWFTALLILRYGEEERGYDAGEVARAVAEADTPACSTDPQYMGWPLAFSDDDRKRGMELLAGEKWPPRGMLTVLDREPQSPTAEG